MKALNWNNESFEQEVNAADVPVLVDFWAPWCGPCRVMGPLVDELAEELDGRVKVVKVDVNESAELANQYGVMSIPAFAVFKDGKVQQRAVGVMDKEKLLSFVEPHLN